MKPLSMLGIIVGAALLTAVPVSVQWTPQKVGLYVDKADAQYGVYRRHYRRAYRRAYYGGYYGYGYPYYYGYYPYYYGGWPWGWWWWG
jgi:hypothetical protein